MDISTTHQYDTNLTMQKLLEISNEIAEKGRSCSASYVIVNGFTAYLINRYGKKVTAKERKIINRVAMKHQPLKQLYKNYEKSLSNKEWSDRVPHGIKINNILDK